MITCGEDFEHWYSAQGFISRYYLDAISGAIVSVAQEKMMNVIEKKFGLSQTSRMSPGSLPDWPLEQQKLLFVLLGEEEVYKNVGVNLTENYVMLPTKSLSGIIFPTEHDFESCQLCKREDCPGRKAEYDPQKARFYRDYDI